MQDSYGNSQAIVDERANGVEDSPLVTIEYLRGRLLSERSVSKAAKQRGDELAKRVKELEEQLKIASIQRKRAEKATLDVLLYLESHGVSDVSEVSVSDYDEEDFLCESNVLKSREDKNLGSKEFKENGKGSSDSEHESTPSSNGSLSWKGRKRITQLLQKKNLDSSIHRQTNFPLVNSSPRHRLGKSCRQVKRRERSAASAAEELKNDSVKSDMKDDNNGDSCDQHDIFLDTRGQELKNSSERRVQRGSKKVEASLSLPEDVQVGDASSSNCGNECNGDMERALKNQAELIGLYETQGKAQSDWEEKYGENQVSTTDSCEPVDHSDITEERDENRGISSHPGDVAACHDTDQKAVAEIHFQNESLINHFNSFKLSPPADAGCSGDDKLNEMLSFRSPASEFEFPTLTSYETQKHEEGNSFHEARFAALSGGDNLSGSHHTNLVQHALAFNVTCEEPGVVLNALQRAKEMLNRQINSLPESGASAEKETRPSVSAINDGEWLKIPAACPGIFRVPTDLPSQLSTNSRALVLRNASEVANSRLYPSAPFLQDDQNISSPAYCRLRTLSGDAYSSTPVYPTDFGSARPEVGFPSNTNVALSSSKSAVLPYSSFLPRMSSSLTLFSQSPSSEAVISPSGSSLYNHDSSMYR